MQLRVTTAFVLGLTLLVITQVVPADPIRGPAPVKNRGSRLAPGLAPMFVGWNENDVITQVLMNTRTSADPSMPRNTNTSKIDSAGTPMPKDTDKGNLAATSMREETNTNKLNTGSWNDQEASNDTRNSAESTVGQENGKRITTDNLDAAPESRVVLPLGLLTAGLLLLRKRIVAVR